MQLACEIHDALWFELPLLRIPFKGVYKAGFVSQNPMYQPGAFSGAYGKHGTLQNPELPET